MKFEEKAILLTAESTPYKMNGNEGVSHKIRLNIDNEIFLVNSSAEQVAVMKQYEGKEGTATVTLSSRKENLKLVLESFSI